MSDSVYCINCDNEIEETSEHVYVCPDAYDNSDHKSLFICEECANEIIAEKGKALCPVCGADLVKVEV
jgi:Zn finger protein HypA/HybF involved in hydrogenase expression